MNKRLWKTGVLRDIHIYDDRNVPIATALTAESAQQIVDEHNMLCTIYNTLDEHNKPRGFDVHL